MEKRILGRTGLEVFPLAYGAMELNRCKNDAEAEAILNQVLDLGINYIDTSPEYATSEDRIGKAIAKRRGEYILATKCGDLEGNFHYEFSRKVMIDNLENSLRRMKTDHVDIWQLHGATPMHFPNGQKEEAFQVMKEMQQQGKVRFLGVTMRHGRDYEDCCPTESSYFYAPFFAKLDPIDMIQLVYGGMCRTCEHIITPISRAGRAIIARSGVKWFKPKLYDSIWEEKRMGELVQRGDDQKGFLLRFVISHPDITAPVIGTINPEHLKKNVESINRGPLPENVYREAKYRLPKPYTEMNL
jgi:aryl-alcohol dehydrogenase-like predicted oxidoreductase